jgi:hypothetical protein
VPALKPNADDDSESQRIISPFAQTTSTVQPAGKGNATSVALWIVSSLLVLLILGIIGFFSFRYLEDPFRTMETFSMDKYMADYRPMSGVKFKANLKVSADLGWKPEKGHLMVFNVENDNRPLVVFVPPKLSGIYFTKGQTYQAAIEVGEGGLVYADSFEKE